MNLLLAVKEECIGKGMNTLRRLFIVIVFVLSSGITLVPYVRAVDSQAKEGRDFSSPKRIVSLIPTMTESLFLLDAGHMIVGVSIYCQRPLKAQAIDKAGSVIDANVEKIVALDANLVIVSTLADGKQVKKLQNLGIQVKVFQQARNFQALCQNFIELARLLGKEKKAAAIIKKAEEDLEGTQKDLVDVSKCRVFVQIGANPLFTANSESFLNDIVERAGGSNIASDARQGIFSREEVIRRNPDTIIIVNMGIVGTREKEVWLRYDTVSAVKNRRIFIVDSYRVCSPTPVSFVETMQEFVRIFHGKE